MRSALLLAVFSMAGCSIDTWGRGAPATDSGIDSSISMVDASVEAGMADASMADADAALDAGIDSSVDSGQDSGVDSGVDGGRDAGMLDAGTPDPCETYPGLCIRFTDTGGSGPILSYWFTYITAALTTVEPWRAFTCTGGVVVSGSTSYCLVPETERETGRTMFFYPSHALNGSDTVCTSTGCPRLQMEVWFGGTALTIDMIVQERGDTRPPAAPCGGSNFVFVIRTP